MRKFILIAYKYPPYDQVGSLRWSKLSKYLARLGHEIHVITVDWSGIGSIKTLHDVNHSNIHIHVIPSSYPHRLKYKVFKNRYLNFLKSIPFRFFIDKFFCFDDEAQAWKRPLLKNLDRIVKLQQIDTIITTGGPFQAIRWASHYKKNINPNVKLIHDFRDPWASDPFKAVTSAQRSQILQWQKNCVQTADKIVSVTGLLLKEYLQDLEIKTKGIVITNGFDPESKINLPEISKPLHSIRMTLLHAGNIANGRDKPLFELFQVLNRNQELREKFSIYLIGDIGASMSIKLRHLFPTLMDSECIVLMKRMSQEEVFKLLASATFALHLNGPELPCANSTKIFEYGMMKKPTVSLNYGGEVDELIKTNDLGHSINLQFDNLEQRLLDISAGRYSFKISIEEYSHANLAKKYSELINSL